MPEPWFQYFIEVLRPCILPQKKNTATYPRMTLIKLDFPVPEGPVIAMFTATSRHPSNFPFKSSWMLWTPFFSTSLLISSISVDSRWSAFTEAMVNTGINAMTNSVRRVSLPASMSFGFETKTSCLVPYCAGLTKRATLGSSVWEAILIGSLKTQMVGTAGE